MTQCAKIQEKKVNVTAKINIITSNFYVNINKSIAKFTKKTRKFTITFGFSRKFLAKHRNYTEFLSIITAKFWFPNECLIPLFLIKMLISSLVISFGGFLNPREIQKHGIL